MQRGEGGNMRAFLDWRTYHVALIAMLEGTVKNALLYWCPLIIHSLVGSSHPALHALSTRTVSAQCMRAGRFPWAPDMTAGAAQPCRVPLDLPGEC